DVAEQIQAKIDNSQPKDDGPKEGERNAEGLVFRDGRWHREGGAAVAIEPAAAQYEGAATSIRQLSAEDRETFRILRGTRNAAQFFHLPKAQAALDKLDVKLADLDAQKKEWESSVNFARGNNLDSEVKRATEALNQLSVMSGEVYRKRIKAFEKVEHWKKLAENTSAKLEKMVKGSGNPFFDVASQSEITDPAARAQKAKDLAADGKTYQGEIDAKAAERKSKREAKTANKVVVQKDVAEQIQGKIGAESAAPKTKNRKGEKTPESEWPQKRRDVISGLKERGWVIAPDNDRTAELLVDGHHVGSANLHINFPEEVLTTLTKRNPAWVDSGAANKRFKVSGGESAGEIAESIDKMARAHHEIVAPPEKRTVLAEKPPLNVATKLQGKDVVFTNTSIFGVIDGRAIARYGEHLRDHKFKNGYYADYRDATPDEVKASEKEAAKAAKKAAADAKKAAAKFMNAPSGYASFDDWYADADMPTKLEDGTWVDLETGLPYRAADSRSPKSRSGNAASSKPQRENAPSAPVPQGLPPFSDGKTKGAADYYVKIAQNLLEASKKPHARSALMAEKSKTFTTKAGGLATAWAGKTQNSKLLVEFFNKLLNG
ncbi:MAG: hypothetical protein ACMV0I_07300, partial [Pseudomonas sp.]